MAPPGEQPTDPQHARIDLGLPFLRSINDIVHAHLGNQSTGLLCANCQNLFDLSDGLSLVPASVRYDGAYVCKAAAEECPVCTFIWGELRPGCSEYTQTIIYPPLDPRTYMACDIGRKTLTRIPDPYIALKVPEIMIDTEEKWSTTPQSISLRKCPSPTWQIKERDDEGDGLLNATTQAADSFAASRLNILKTWIGNCLSTHSLCCQTRYPCGKKTFPRRLIAVGKPDNPFLIVNDEFCPQSPAYATVSHRWRLENMPRLLRSNLAEMRSKINVKELPPVFRDAISLCNMLGIGYLFIDALCLVQDDAADVRSEVARMGEIYSYALCNFSAIAAADRPVGLFFDHDTPRNVEFPLVIERESGRISCHGVSSGTIQELNDASLMNRGWVLQERLLSSRSVYFGDQLVWECTQLLANETFPTGMPYKGNPKAWGHAHPLRIASLLKPDSDSDEVDIYLRWLEVVEMYSICALSFETDILPAISGIAHRFQEMLGDKYLAGLWQGYLLQGMLWWRNGPRKHHIYPETYQAPSWSWASIKIRAGVRMYGSVFDLTKYKWVATVIEVSISLVGEDPMGQVSDGYVRVSSALRTCPSRSGTAESLFEQNGMEIYDKEYDETEFRPKLGSFYLVLGYCNVAGFQKQHANREVRSPARVVGIVLEPVTGNVQTFKRVGIFDHAWDLQSLDGDAKLYTNFADFDPDNLERRTVTII